MRTIETHGGGLRDIAVSPDGRWIASTGDFAEVWDAVSGERVFAVPVHSHVDDVAWSPDGGRLATASGDGAARVYDVVEETLVETLELSDLDTENGLYSIAFSSDGTRLMGSDTNVTAVKIWDVSPAGGGEWANFAGAPVAGAASFRDGGHTVIASTGGDQAGTWDIASGELIGTIGVVDTTARSSRIAISRDARFVAMIIDDAMPVDVWDARTNKYLFSVSNPDQTNVWDMDWTPDGGFLALGGADQSGGYVIVVDHEGREVARIREEPDVIVNEVALSPDGQFVAWSRKPERDDPARQGVRIWDLNNNVLVDELKTSGHVEFDPSGKWISTGEMNEAVVHIWDAHTRKEVASLTNAGFFDDVDFSADGSRVATAGRDGVIRIWDTVTGLPLQALSGHGTSVNSTQFSPDGKRLVSTGDDGIVRVWALDLDDLIAIAESRLTRSLTDDECQQFLHVDRCTGSSEVTSVA